MKTAENEAFLKRVIFYFKNVTGKSKVSAVKHFQNEGKSRSTIYQIIIGYLATNKTEYTRTGGHQATVGTSGIQKKILRTFEKNPSISVRAAAKKLQVNRSTLQNIKKKKLGIESYAKKVATKYVEDQEDRAKKGCLHVHKKSLQKPLLLMMRPTSHGIQKTFQERNIFTLRILKHYPTVKK